MTAPTTPGPDDALREARPYGIIDPDYARVFTIARCLAWQEGYALVMHGSFTRDLDMLAVPWTEKATDAEHLVRRIAFALDELNLLVTNPEAASQASEKPHGRLAWTLTFKAFGDPRFIDLSVMPRGTDRDRLARDLAAARDALANVVGLFDQDGNLFCAGEHHIDVIARARAALTPGADHADAR